MRQQLLHSMMSSMFGGGSQPSSSQSAAASSSSSSASSSSASALLNPSSPLWDSSDIDASLDNYSSALESYWSRIPYAHSFAYSRVEILLEDFRSLLSRFAQLVSFSAESRGGGKESNLCFVPYLVQMASFMLFQASQTTRDKIEQQMQTAYLALGGTQSAAASPTPSGSGSGSSSSSSARLSFSALPFLDSSIGASYSSSSSSSSSARSSPPPSPPVTSLSELLDRSSLAGLVPSSFNVGSRIRSSPYSDPLDYLEYLMCLSLVLLSAQQWREIRFALLWRMMRVAKEGMAMAIEAEEEAEREAAGMDVDSAARKSSERNNNSSSSSAAASSAAASSSAAAASSSASDEKESEEKTGESSSSAPSSALHAALLNVLRPIFLFWSLVDRLHGVLSPPSDSSFTAASSDAFLSSSGSSWYRRWGSRRTFARNTQLATFRSILRREHDILTQLKASVLPEYEKQSNQSELAAVIEASDGVKQEIEKQGFTLESLLHAISTHVSDDMQL